MKANVTIYGKALEPIDKFVDRLADIFDIDEVEISGGFIKSVYGPGEDIYCSIDIESQDAEKALAFKKFTELCRKNNALNFRTRKRTPVIIDIFKFN